MADTTKLTAAEETTTKLFPDDPLTGKPNQAQTAIDFMDTWGTYISKLIDMIKGFFADLAALLA